MTERSEYGQIDFEGDPMEWLHSRLSEIKDNPDRVQRLKAHIECLLEEGIVTELDIDQAINRHKRMNER